MLRLALVMMVMVLQASCVLSALGYFVNDIPSFHARVMASAIFSSVCGFPRQVT